MRRRHAAGHPRHVRHVRLLSPCLLDCAPLLTWRRADTPAGAARLAIRGMTCASCSAAVEAALRGLPGVTEASVNLLANQALVKYDPRVIGESMYGNK